MSYHGILLFSDTAARNEEGGRPRRESSLLEQNPEDGIDRRPGITFKPRSSADRFRASEHPARCRRLWARRCMTPGRPAATSRAASVRRRRREFSNPRVPGDDAHRDSRGVRSAFGDRSRVRRREVLRMVLSPTGTRFSVPSADWPSAIPPNRRISVEPQRQPIGKGRQANLADEPSVAKESG
jgi:hypothetical protein